MNLNKYTSLGFFTLAATLSCVSAAIVKPQVDIEHNLVFFADSSDTLAYTGSAGFMFFGTFSDIGSISVASTAQSIEDDFRELGLSAGGSADLADFIASSAVFSQNVEETDFESQRGYLVIANNSDIGSATEIAIVSNSASAEWSFASSLTEISDKTTYSLSTSDLAVAEGGNVDFVIGSYGAGGAGFETIQMAIVTVPEPSSFALLGLGAAAMLFRRKK